MFSLLKDGTFTTFVLIPLALAGLVVLASGSLVAALLLHYISPNLAYAFTPEFIRVVVLLILLEIPLMTFLVGQIVRGRRVGQVVDTSTIGEKNILPGTLKYVPAKPEETKKLIETWSE